MPHPIFTISSKEFFKGILNAMGWTFWTFKWFFIAAIGVNVFFYFLDDFLKIKIFRIIFIITLILLTLAFFVWIYS